MCWASLCRTKNPVASRWWARVRQISCSTPVPITGTDRKCARWRKTTGSTFWSFTRASVWRLIVPRFATLPWRGVSRSTIRTRIPTQMIRLSSCPWRTKTPPTMKFHRKFPKYSLMRSSHSASFFLDFFLLEKFFIFCIHLEINWNVFDWRGYFFPQSIVQILIDVLGQSIDWLIDRLIDWIFDWLNRISALQNCTEMILYSF